MKTRSSSKKRQLDFTNAPEETLFKKAKNTKQKKFLVKVSGEDKYQDIFELNLSYITKDTELMSNIEFAIDFNEFKKNTRFGVTFTDINGNYVTLEPKSLKTYSSLQKLFFYRLCAFYESTYSHSFIIDNLKSILQGYCEDETTDIRTENILEFIKKNIEHIKNCYLKAFTKIFKKDSPCAEEILEIEGFSDKETLLDKFNQKTKDLLSFYEDFNPDLIDKKDEISRALIFSAESFNNNGLNQLSFTP